jgi:senataxin
VDEAAQAVELTCLIPLRHRCPRLVLIGDPMQLPATVISTHAARHGYDRSLFERLTRAGMPARMLNVQYRMSPLISYFPSRRFYDRHLLVSIVVATCNKTTEC